MYKILHKMDHWDTDVAKMQLKFQELWLIHFINPQWAGFHKSGVTIR